jgi:hypothetical protein
MPTTVQTPNPRREAVLEPMAWQAELPHGAYQQQFAKCYNNFHTHYKQNFPCFSIKF